MVRSILAAVVPDSRARIGTVSVVGLWLLGCGGLGPQAAPEARGEIEAPARSGPEPLTGKWCMTDEPPCYLFEGDKVMEDVGGPKWQEWGTFVVEDDLLILTWTDPFEVMTWQIVRRTKSMLVLHDIKHDEMFSMAAVDEFPPYAQRPRH